MLYIIIRDDVIEAAIFREKMSDETFVNEELVFLEAIERSCILKGANHPIACEKYAEIAHFYDINNSLDASEKYYRFAFLRSQVGYHPKHVKVFLYEEQLSEVTSASKDSLYI